MSNVTCYETLGIRAIAKEKWHNVALTGYKRVACFTSVGQATSELTYQPRDLIMSMSKTEVLRAACCVAGLDGKVCERERVMLERLAEHAGAGKASLNAMIQRAESDPNFYEEMFHSLADDAEWSIRVLLCLAAADEDVSMEQRVVMGIFAKRLGLDEAHYDKLVEDIQQHTEYRIASKNGK